MAKKGAQNGAYLHNPDPAMLHRLQVAANGLVKLVTLACEQPGAMEFIKGAIGDGVTVSLGHTTANYDTAYAAYAAGARRLPTCSTLCRLYPSGTWCVGAAFDHREVKVELICDGVHIHPSVIRAVFQLFGRDRVIMVSDSLRATGMPDGEYPFGGQAIEVHGNRATIKGDPNTLAGSVSDLMQCVKTVMALESLWRMPSLQRR
jgi:N-acetylglucosamine-6-phosphate deacetylase